VFTDRSIKETILSLGLENFLRILLGAAASILVGRHLGPADYGKFSYTLSVVLIFSPLLNFSMNEVIVKTLVDGGYAEREVFTSGLRLRFLLGLIGILCCLGYAFLGDQSHIAFFPIALYCLFFFLKSFDIVEYFFIAKQRVAEVSKVRSLIFIGINILKFLLVYLKEDWLWFIYVSCAELAFVFLLYVIKGSNESWFSFNLKTEKGLTYRLFKKSFPFFLITLLMVLFTRADHLMIWEFLDKAKLGEYSVVVKWGEFLNFVPLLLTSTFLPKIIEESKNGATSTSLKLFFRLIFCASLLITLFFNLVGPTFIGSLYGGSYVEAPQLIRLYSFQICISFFFAGLVRYLLVVDRMISAIALYGLALFLNLGINFFFIPWLGLQGAIYASIVAYLGSLVLGLVKDSYIRKGAGLYIRSLF